MNAPFEHWAKTEINKLRTEADILERALVKYLESQAPTAAPQLDKIDLTPAPRRIDLNGHRQAKPLGKRGEKNITALKAIRDAGDAGSTTDDICTLLIAQYPDTKRSTVRALLWHEKRLGTIAQQDNGRYTMTEEGLRKLS